MRWRSWFKGHLVRRRRNGTSFQKDNRAVQVESLEPRELLTISFQFDYRYDSTHFFDVTARRTALEQAGHLVADQFGDSLTAIQPSGTNRWTPNITSPSTGLTTTLPSNTAVAANQILVFVGDRNINSLGIGGPGGYSSSGSTSWLNTVKTRGQAGAASSTSPTDTSPWGGSVTFDSAGVNWFFGSTTAGLNSTQVDFLSVAVHELTHVVGFVTNNRAFTRDINSAGMFFGSNAVAANSNQLIPMDSTRGHWREGTMNDGVETAMDPSINRGTRKMLTSLDRAALRDIGWQITPANQALVAARTTGSLAPASFVSVTTTAADNLGSGLPASEPIRSARDSVEPHAGQHSEPATTGSPDDHSAERIPEGHRHRDLMADRLRLTDSFFDELSRELLASVATQRSIRAR